LISSPSSTGIRRNGAEIGLEEISVVRRRSGNAPVGGYVTGQLQSSDALEWPGQIRDCGRMTGKQEVIPDQKSRCGKSHQIDDEKRACIDWSGLPPSARANRKLSRNVSSVPSVGTTQAPIDRYWSEGRVFGSPLFYGGIDPQRR